MSDRITVQYVGFEAKTLERVYIFSTLGAPDEPREFTLTILNEAFVSHRVSYQDAPNICSLKLHRELATQGRSEEHTSELQSPMYLVCRLLLEKKNILMTFL